MKKHAGIYPYHCPYCNKGIHTLDSIKVHIKTHHTGLLGFHCNRCKLEFNQINELKSHLDSCIFIANE